MRVIAATDLTARTDGAGHTLTLAPIREGSWPEGGACDPRAHPASRPAVIVDADTGLLRLAQKKIAIIGFAETTSKLAPYDDPAWCIVTMNQYYRYAQRADLHFEIHRRDQYEQDVVPGTDYLGWLRRCPIPVIMNERRADVPQSVRYPVERIIERWGRDYFTCSVAYEIAWAIEQAPEEIGLWGVDLAVGGEYFFERPCAEYWLGIARGLGVRVTIPEGAALLKASHRYGYEAEPALGAIAISDLKARMAVHAPSKARAAADFQANHGACLEDEALMHLATEGTTITAALLADRLAEHAKNKMIAHAQHAALDGALQELHYWLAYLEVRAHGSTVPAV